MTKLRMKISGVFHSEQAAKDMVAESAAPLASPRPIVAPTSEDVARVHLNVHFGWFENVLRSGNPVEPGRNRDGLAVDDELTARWTPRDGSEHPWSLVQPSGASDSPS